MQLFPIRFVEVCVFSCLRAGLLQYGLIYASADPGASADLAVILMQEGLAHIFLVGRRYDYAHESRHL